MPLYQQTFPQGGAQYPYYGFDGEHSVQEERIPPLQVERYGAKGGGVDDTAAFNIAIAIASAVGGGRVTVQPGRSYTVLDIAMQSNVTLDMAGGKLLKTAGGAATHAINLTGTTTGSATALTANVAIGDQTLSAVSFPALAAGDYFILRDATYKYSTTGRNQEINRVDTNVGGVLTMMNRAMGSYATASTAEVIKLLPISDAVITGGKIIISPLPAGNIGGGIYGKLTYNCRIDNVIVSGSSDDPGIGFEQSAFGVVTRCTVRDGQRQSTGGYGYGIQLNESSHHMLVIGNTTENIRENPITNNTRWSAFVNNVCRSHYDSGVNTHGAGCEHILIAGNVISGARANGIAVGFTGSPAPDTDVRVFNNEVGNSGGNAISVAGVATGTRGARVQVKGNTISRWNVLNVGTTYAILVTFNDDVLVEGNFMDGGSLAVGQAGVYLLDAKNVDVSGCQVINLANGFGYQYQTVDTVTFRNNRARNINSNNIRAIGTNVSVTIEGLEMDDDSVVTDANTSGRWSAPGVSADRGDADFTSKITDPTETRFDSALSLNRVHNMPINGKWLKGETRRTVRTGLGAGTLAVRDGGGTVIKTIPAATAAFVDVTFNGTNVKLSAYGLL